MGIQISKKVGRPTDDPSSTEVADAFPRSPIGGRMLETAMKSLLDYAWDRSTGGTAGATVDSSGSIMTADLTRTPIDGAADGSAAAPPSLTIPTLANGASVGGSVVGADNARIDSGATFDGTSGSLAGTDGVSSWLFLDSRKDPALVTAIFLIACRRISVIETHALVRIAEIKRKRSVQNSKINKKMKWPTMLYLKKLSNQVQHHRELIRSSVLAAVKLSYLSVRESLSDQQNPSDYSHWGWFSDRSNTKESPKEMKKKQRKIDSSIHEWTMEDRR